MNLKEKRIYLAKEDIRTEIFFKEVSKEEWFKFWNYKEGTIVIKEEDVALVVAELRKEIFDLFGNEDGTTDIENASKCFEIIDLIDEKLGCEKPTKRQKIIWRIL